MGATIRRGEKTIQLIKVRSVGLGGVRRVLTMCIRSNNERIVNHARNGFLPELTGRDGSGVGRMVITMKTGALIVAAGMSTRMKQTKQIMKFGNDTMIERIVRCFYAAGVNDVAIVLGHKAEEIREALKEYPVTFLYNKDYATTQMFDSVKIGLEYWKERCDRILFCPVDASAFSMDTLKELLTHEEDWIYPFCNGRIGHPILISASLISRILAHTGGGGLKGALDSLGISPVVMEVADAGSVMDADTPEDYEKMKAHLLEKEQDK